VASLNDAMDAGAFAYLRDRLSLFGVDDVLVYNEATPADAIRRELGADGFEQMSEDDLLTWLHRDGSARAVAAEWEGLAIGNGAVNYSFLFPRLVKGDSIYVDEYPLEELFKYKTLVLQVAWYDQLAAETLVEKAVARDVVDLTRSQQDPLAQIPEFLGIWGEPIILDTKPVILFQQGAEIRLYAFGTPDELWFTLTPQGLQQNEATFDYLGQQAAVAGWIQRGNNRIWFLGLNLAYHALVTHDTAALGLIGNLLKMEPGEINNFNFIPLEEYVSGPQGYTFRINLEKPTDVLVPVACFDGTRVWLNGKQVPVRSQESLLLFSAPEGEQEVRIDFGPSIIHRLGLAVSGKRSGTGSAEMYGGVDAREKGVQMKKIN
jgi:hypothetical protein